MNYLTYQKRLAYLLELLTKEATVSPSIMSKKFECSTKTIKRMVTHLREDGYEIKWCRKKKSYVIENVIA
jgi:biotin operon repressor